MILNIKKTNEGTEWQVSNRHDKLNRWSGTVRMSNDENDIDCQCTQARNHIDCTHKVQVREYMEMNNHKINE